MTHPQPVNRSSSGTFKQTHSSFLDINEINLVKEPQMYHMSSYPYQIAILKRRNCKGKQQENYMSASQVVATSCLQTSNMGSCEYAVAIKVLWDESDV